MRIAALKPQPDKNMMILGSASIVSQLTQHGLIDVPQFIVWPMLLADVRELLDSMSKSVKLELEETRKYPSGDISLHYAHRRADRSVETISGRKVIAVDPIQEIDGRRRRKGSR